MSERSFDSRAGARRAQGSEWWEDVRGGFWQSTSRPTAVRVASPERGHGEAGALVC